MKKKSKKLELELKAVSLEFQNIPRTWIQIQDCRQKTNIMSGCPQHLEIEKELKWILVLQGDVCRKLGEVACISKERWDELQEKIGWIC